LFLGPLPRVEMSWNGRVREWIVYVLIQIRQVFIQRRGKTTVHYVSKVDEHPILPCRNPGSDHIKAGDVASYDIDLLHVYYRAKWIR
jgi:hypothetical protein